MCWARYYWRGRTRIARRRSRGESTRRLESARRPCPCFSVPAFTSRIAGLFIIGRLVRAHRSRLHCDLTAIGRPCSIFAPFLLSVFPHRYAQSPFSGRTRAKRPNILHAVSSLITNSSGPFDRANWLCASTTGPSSRVFSTCKTCRPTNLARSNWHSLRSPRK